VSTGWTSCPRPTGRPALARRGVLPPPGLDSRRGGWASCPRPAGRPAPARSRLSEGRLAPGLDSRRGGWASCPRPAGRPAPARSRLSEGRLAPGLDSRRGGWASCPRPVSTLGGAAGAGSRLSDAGRGATGPGRRFRRRLSFLYAMLVDRKHSDRAPNRAGPQHPVKARTSSTDPALVTSKGGLMNYGWGRQRCWPVPRNRSGRRHGRFRLQWPRPLRRVDRRSGVELLADRAVGDPESWMTVRPGRELDLADAGERGVRAVRLYVEVAGPACFARGDTGERHSQLNAPADACVETGAVQQRRRTGAGEQNRAGLSG
jgi:hypothetical protein